MDEIFKNGIVFFRHTYAFINAEGFRSEKRFARYVSKVKALCDKLIREQFEDDLTALQFIEEEIRFKSGKYWTLPDLGNLNDADCDETDKDFEDEDCDEDDELPEFLQEELNHFFSIIHHPREMDEEFDVKEELELNSSYLHRSVYEEPCAEALWVQIFHAFNFYDMLQTVKAQNLDSETAKQLLEDEEAITHNYKLLKRIIEDEFAECCWDYLHTRITDENSTINIDNYAIHGLPRGDGETMRIISNTIDRASIAILNAMRNENSVSVEDQVVLKQHLQTISELSKENEDLEDELDDALDKNVSLQKKLDEFEDIKKKEMKQMKVQIQNLSYENSKLEKKNTELEEECKRLRSLIAIMQEVAQEKEEDEIDEEDIVDVDCNKKYVFVMDGNPYGEEPIRKTFPNSSIISDNINLNPKNIDAVICITSRVKHCVYNPIKNQCKQKGIPFVHCVQNNVEFIKRALTKLN